MQEQPKTIGFGICKFCGQTVTYETSGEEVDAGEMHCKCIDAMRYQRTERAYETVDDICIKDAERNGFDALKEEQVEKIRSACENIINGSIETATYCVADSDTVKLSLKDGFVYVKRKKTLVMEAM